MKEMGVIAVTLSMFAWHAHTLRNRRKKDESHAGLKPKLCDNEVVVARVAYSCRRARYPHLVVGSRRSTTPNSPAV